MKNYHFSAALHIMTLLARDEQAWLTSGQIASSMNVQAAAVRKEISCLRTAGLVECREGKHGGIRLARPASGIRLSEIYESVTPAALLEKIKSPNSTCFVGKQINLQLDRLFLTLNKAFLGELKRMSLAQFYHQFH
ncbi:MAG: Rrf2 family transcriptional regulator [Flavihumibacter sp.]